MKKRFKVSSQEQGQRLLAFLRTHFAGGALSVKALKRCVEQKRCRINGRVETFSTHILAAGDTIEIDVGDDPSRQFEPLLLWEDEALAAYDKPAGLVSEKGNFPFELVHRLDKETSGVILLAKSSLVLEKMIELFRKKQVRKEYLAIVDGLVHEKKKTITSQLAPRHRFQGQVIYASAPLGHKVGQEAITSWELLGCGEKASLLLCLPITGRTHQLRVHLKEAGHPILGDYQYAKRFYCPVEVRRHMLHAYRIAFPHPLGSKDVDITAPVPPDFIDVLRNIGISDEILNH